MLQPYSKMDFIHLLSQNSIPTAPSWQSEKSLWKVTENFLQRWRSKCAQWPPSPINGRSLEPPTFPANRVIWVGVFYSGKWRRTWWSLSQSSSIALWRKENLAEGQLFLQHSPNQACIVKWPVNGTWKSAWSLPKGTGMTPILFWTAWTGRLVMV